MIKEKKEAFLRNHVIHLWSPRGLGKRLQRGGRKSEEGSRNKAEAAPGWSLQPCLSPESQSTVHRSSFPAQRPDTGALRLSDPKTGPSRSNKRRVMALFSPNRGFLNQTQKIDYIYIPVWPLLPAMAYLPLLPSPAKATIQAVYPEGKDGEMGPFEWVFTVSRLS